MSSFRIEGPEVSVLGAEQRKTPEEQRAYRATQASRPRERELPLREVTSVNGI